jgi:hypothetical protein
MELLKREDVVGIVSRHMATPYANSVFGTMAPKLKWCDHHKKLEPINNFYVKKERQHIAKENLTVDDFRHVCIEIWDEMNENLRNGFGWATDQEVIDQNNASNLTKFLVDGD